MDLRRAEEILDVLDSSITLVKWRLRPSAKRRLETDILALSTRMRAVVMVDYGGKMPELRDHLCALMTSMRKECNLLLSLRIILIEDMIYMVHVEELAELSNLSLQQKLHFVDIEVDPPQLLLQSNENQRISEFVSVQKLFASIFQCDLVVDTTNASPQCELFELTSFLKDTEITIPVLNGWLLGYPVVYLFSKDHIADAVYNLSTKYLHIYKIIICRRQMPSRKICEEELLSFSVPYELSVGRDKESWAEAFFSRLLVKFENCKHIWSSIRLEQAGIKWSDIT